MTTNRVEFEGNAASTWTFTLANSADSEAGMASRRCSQFAALGVMSSLTRNASVTSRELVELTLDASVIALSLDRWSEKTCPSRPEEKLEPRDLGLCTARNRSCSGRLGSRSRSSTIFPGPRWTWNGCGSHYGNQMSAQTLRDTPSKKRQTLLR